MLKNILKTNFYVFMIKKIKKLPLVGIKADDNRSMIRPHMVFI